ncbi:putative morphogenetic protein [Escherichia coli]|nr:putative morphogenetic protein [Escherichia coli]
MTYSYECSHCGNTHHADINLSDLAQTVEILTVPPYVKTNVPVNGVPTDWILKPLTGKGVELLERMRASLPDMKSPEYSAGVARMRIAELALCTALEDDPEDFTQAANRRFDIIESMALETEFTPLVARIQLMQKDLRHGLKMSIERGSSRLILPPQHCKNAKEGADVTTTLYVPFSIESLSHQLDLNGWLTIINNLTLYGYQPVSDVEQLPQWRALHMSKALEEKIQSSSRETLSPLVKERLF